jgi:hypothetical protein
LPQRPHRSHDGASAALFAIWQFNLASGGELFYDDPHEHDLNFSP